jgi:CRISPR-associated protein Cas2
LFWIQNSVFEGEVTKSEYNYIVSELNNIIDPDEDSIIIYRFRTRKEVNREILGIEKSPINEIL